MRNIFVISETAAPLRAYASQKLQMIIYLLLNGNQNKYQVTCDRLHLKEAASGWLSG